MMRKAYDIFLTTLANMNRLEIINSLRRNEINVSEISNKTGLNQTTVSHNLKRLFICGFVTVRQKGKHRYYSLNKDTIKPLMEIIDIHVNKYCKKIAKDIKYWR